MWSLTQGAEGTNERKSDGWNDFCARLCHMRELFPVCALISIFVVGCTSVAPLTTTSPSSTRIGATSTTTAEAIISTTAGTTTTTASPGVDAPVIITTPGHGDVVDWFRGEFVISTEPGSTVTINAERVELSDDGTYVLPVVNTPGDNVMYVTSSDSAGNLSSVRVRYEFATHEGWIAAIGDSVMLGSKIEIEKRLGDGIVDATVSRQFLHARQLVAELVARPNPPLVIIIGLGTNGRVQMRHFDEVMDIAGAQTLMVFVNVRVPRSWEAASNFELAAGVDRYDNAVLVDWYAHTRDRDEFFAADGLHPRQTARVIMADLIAAAIFPNWVSMTAERRIGRSTPEAESR